MASVKICPSCTHRNSAAALLCANCRVPIARIAALDTDEAQEATDELRKESDSVRCPDPTCGELNPPGETRCLRCSGRLPIASPVTVRLIWPWGEVRVDDMLAIGRDPDFSPLAQPLAAYGNVSRRHAELRIENGNAFIRDVKSSHGTYVNDRSDAIASGEWVPIRDGDRVRFARYGPTAMLKVLTENG